MWASLSTAAACCCRFEGPQCKWKQGRGASMAEPMTALVGCSMPETLDYFALRCHLFAPSHMDCHCSSSAQGLCFWRRRCSSSRLAMTGADLCASWRTLDSAGELPLLLLPSPPCTVGLSNSCLFHGYEHARLPISLKGSGSSGAKAAGLALAHKRLTALLLGVAHSWQG